MVCINISVTCVRLEMRIHPVESLSISSWVSAPTTAHEDGYYYKTPTDSSSPAPRYVSAMLAHYLDTECNREELALNQYHLKCEDPSCVILNITSSYRAPHSIDGCRQKK
jgi:hypothetical protein